jgi:hypothetical protein
VFYFYEIGKFFNDAYHSKGPPVLYSCLFMFIIFIICFFILRWNYINKNESLKSIERGFQIIEKSLENSYGGIMGKDLKLVVTAVLKIFK